MLGVSVLEVNIVHFAQASLFGPVASKHICLAAWLLVTTHAHWFGGKRQGSQESSRIQS